jgi:hypothetical protein
MLLEFSFSVSAFYGAQYKLQSAGHMSIERGAHLDLLIFEAEFTSWTHLQGQLIL